MIPPIDKQASVLLIKAAEDEAVLTLEGIPDGPFGFHVQQAIEKLLKAFLCQRSIDYRFTHDLNHLANMLRSAGGELPDCCKDFSLIGEYAVTHRYDDIPEFLVLDRPAAIETVRLLREHIVARISALSAVP
jgi:hypothetical protein